MGSEQERMVVSGFLKEEDMKNRTVCTPFYLHRSSRVLRGEECKLLQLAIKVKGTAKVSARYNSVAPRRSSICPSARLASKPG